MKGIFKKLPILILAGAASAILLYGLTLHPNRVDLDNALTAPNAAHLFGTDHMGRDLLARIAYGGIRDLGLGLTITGLSLTIGTLLGLAAGFQGGRMDSVLIVIMDLLMSVPHTIMALVIMLYLGYGTVSLIAALAVTGWVKYARVVRAESFSMRESDFIIYEKYIGIPRVIILIKHMLPNVFPPVLGLAALDMGHVLLSIAALGFLGFGIQPPTPEWGTMIMETRAYLMIAPWNAIFPGLCIFIYMILFTLLSQKLQKRINSGQVPREC